jgi:hypothetical protein
MATRNSRMEEARRQPMGLGQKAAAFKEGVRIMAREVGVV